MGKTAKQKAFDKQLLIELCCGIAAGVLERSDDCPEIIKERFRSQFQKNGDYERPVYYRLCGDEWYMKSTVFAGDLSTVPQAYQGSFELILPYFLVGKTMNEVIAGRFNYGEFAAKQLGNTNMALEVFANTPLSLSNPKDFEKLAEVFGETFMIHHMFNSYLPLMDMLCHDNS